MSQINYINAINHAMNKLPQADVEYVKEIMAHANNLAIAKGKSNENLRSDIDIRLMIVTNRYNNKICDTCYDKKNPDILKACVKCKLTFYCSKECQLKAWPKHKLWCCNPHAERDTGPQAPVIVECKPENLTIQDGVKIVKLSGDEKVIR